MFRVFRHPGSDGGTRPQIMDKQEILPTRHTPATELLDLFRSRQTADEKFKQMISPLDIFTLPRNEMASFLVKFIRKAQEEGQTDAAIWNTLRAYKYANRLRKWQDTSKDQAPSVIVCSNTTTLDWFDVLEGGRPIISKGKFYNGAFGNWESVRKDDEIACMDDLTQVLYILNHGVKKENPLPAYILFAGRSKPANSDDPDATLDATAEQVRKRFGKFVEDSGKTPDSVYRLIDLNDLKCMIMWYPKTETPVMIPMIGMIYEEERNKFYVLELGKEDGRPVDAVDWFSNSSNIAGMLDISQKKLKHLLTEVFPKLLEKKSWQEKMAAGPAHAQLAHSYEVIMRHAENLGRREEESHDSRWLRVFMRWKKKHGCVDSRQCGCNSTSLGALPMQHNVLAAQRTKEERQVVPHLNCGYLTTVLSLHQIGKKMLQIMTATIRQCDDREQRLEIKNAQRFLAENLKRLFTGDYLGPLANAGLFRHYMSILGIEEKLDVYSVFEKIFLKNEQLTRSTLRHAYENKVIEWDVNNPLRTVPVMKAAKNVDEMLSDLGFREQEGKWVRNADGAVQEITPEHYMVLMSEEFARGMRTGFMEEFREGRIYKVPPKPVTPWEVMNTVREDAYIGKLAPEDVSRLDAEGKFAVFDVLALVQSG